ncbi:hypothetical protein I4U23_023720 [Adineta vaga]|nr:hypothetical protein I4U23_023720 [Adineta vaga]
MASEKCTIQVYVRRTGEIVPVEVTFMSTTFGDIVKIICERINESEPSHYYISLNNETQMLNDMIFEPRHENQKFEMILKTKWLLERIAERSIQKERLQSKIRDELEEDDTVIEEESIPRINVNTTSVKQPIITIPVNEPITTSSDILSTTSNSFDQRNSTQQNKVILGNVVRQTIRKIPRHDVQKYLHRSLEKSFDILLMGSPRVGKSTLINAILKKDLAKTSAGRNACTNAMTYYEYQETYTSAEDSSSPITSKCSIRIWDAPGIEDWTTLDIAKHIQNLVKEKNPICLIYCASPGSYANVEHIKVVIEQCKKLRVFIALVVTNMYASDEVDEILETFKELLLNHSVETNVVDDVHYFGTIGLCAAVNSVVYETEDVQMPPAGVDELMLGIMNSLSEEKLLQWCFALMDNGPFWVRAQSRIWKTFNLFKRWIGF